MDTAAHRRRGSEANSLEVIAMDTKLYDVASIKSGMPFPQRMDSGLTIGQQRVLELVDGDSFVLQTIRISEDQDVTAKAHSQDAAHIATRLASWARGRHVRLAYRMIDKDTARIWRLGTV
ncbi:hypothetical protein [Rhodanobacter sp. MP7CTX1]|jgi:hypothetical protein|uniref:hypothetical protein n=1 Tax=Rhodanobacter sp. MP7CTX1 TaxID=2723084 RepID=UPI00161A01B6|nr:hypothetical protein [Rhodanobacter sp. MP7CTX1]MBB6187741.1 hypothetical protein [Rhodanobacter sp. MP7CTX1]